jgi:vacuolar protein 8
LLESGDRKLIDIINKSSDVMDVVRQISERNVESEGEGDGAESEDGEAEVVALARRCLEISGGGEVKAGSYASSDRT